MLPKLIHPTFEVTIPSNKRKIRVRPMTFGEEKVLLVAKESDDSNDILAAIKQVVQVCIIDKIDIDTLAIFDLEYLFVFLRSKSVNNIIEQTFKDNEDEGEKVREFKIDLDKVEVKYPTDVSSTIAVDTNTQIVMKYPAASLYGDKAFLALSNDDAHSEMIARCIDKVIVGAAEYPAADTPHDELIEFVNAMPLKTYNKVSAFISTLPRLNYVIKYTNDKGTEREIVYSSLSDFFTFV